MDERKRVKPSRRVDVAKGNSARSVKAGKPKVPRAIQLGYAKRRGANLQYDWEAIEAGWLIWPGERLADFCRFVGIEAQYAQKKIGHVKKKSASARGWVSRARMHRIVPTITDPAAEPEVMRAGCARAMEAALATIAYAHDRLTVDGENDRYFNARLKPIEAYRASRILKDACLAMSVAYDLSRSIPSSEEAVVRAPRHTLRIAN